MSAWELTETRCRVAVCDYRDLESDQPYDKIASVGMFEHVGEALLFEYLLGNGTDDLQQISAGTTARVECNHSIIRESSVTAKLFAQQTITRTSWLSSAASCWSASSILLRKSGRKSSFNWSARNSSLTWPSSPKKMWRSLEPLPQQRNTSSARRHSPESFNPTFPF